MDNSPILSAYADEQNKLDNSLSEEIAVWSQIKTVLDINGYDIQLGLVNGLPDMSLVKVK